MTIIKHAVLSLFVYLFIVNMQKTKNQTVLALIKMKDKPNNMWIIKWLGVKQVLLNSLMTDTLKAPAKRKKKGLEFHA